MREKTKRGRWGENILPGFEYAFVQKFKAVLHPIGTTARYIIKSNVTFPAIKRIVVRVNNDHRSLVGSLDSRAVHARNASLIATLIRSRVSPAY